MRNVNWHSYFTFLINAKSPLQFYALILQIIQIVLDVLQLFGDLLSWDVVRFDLRKDNMTPLLKTEKSSFVFF